MHSSLAARAGAILLASVTALGLANAPATATPAASFATFAITSNVITPRATTQFFGTVTTTQPVVSATTRVTVNGKAKGTARLFVGTGNGGIDLPRTWGAGQVRLGPTTFTYADGTTSVSARNTYFNARRNIKVARADNIALKAVRTGDRVRFRAQKIKVLAPARGTYVSLGTVRLQYLTKGRWRDVALIKLDAAGNGTLTRTITASHRYRLHTDQSATRIAFRSRSLTI